MTCKTLLFGFDGLEHTYLERLMEEGLLPNFRKLRDQSRRAAIVNYSGMGAGAFWSSAATGATPAEHGRYFFLQFNPKTYDTEPFHEKYEFRRRPFWETLDQQDRRAAVIDWHRAPFAQMRNGVMVDNWLGHDSPSGLRTSPPDLANKILNHYGHDPLAGGYANYGFASSADHRRFTQDAVKRIEYKVHFAIDQLTAHSWEVFTPCFTELHDLGHYYLHLTRRDHEDFSQALLDEIGEPIRECYLALDVGVGKIRDAAGADAVVMMLAGPGMTSLVSANGAMDEIALKLDLGYSPPVTGGRIARSAYRQWIPNSLRMRVAPFARRARRIFADNDYKTRRFFAVPHNDNAGCIRVNLKGREKFGTISPGKEYDAILEEIKTGLLSLRNAENDAPAVANVTFTQKSLSGPYIDELPDVFAEWDRGHNTRNFKVLTSERTGDIKAPSHLRNGDHTQEGVFWSTGDDHPIFSAARDLSPHETTDAILASIR